MDDLAIAPDRAIELLQIAVDHEDEIVELFTGREIDRAQRLWLPHLAVTEEGPDPLLAGVLDASVVQIPIEPRLVDGVHCPQAHRYRGELPEVRHQPRVGIRREALVWAMLNLLAEVEQLPLAQAPFQKSSRIDARRGMALEEDLVATAGVILASEEVIEADFVETRGRLIGGDVAADLKAWPVGIRHHDCGIPSDVAAHLSLDVFIPGEPRLLTRRDGVDEVGTAQVGQTHSLLAGSLQEPQHHITCSVLSPLINE